MLHHGYVQLESSDAFHMRSTLVAQASESSYTLTEAALGGILARHDLVIQQARLEKRPQKDCSHCRDSCSVHAYDKTITSGCG